MASGTKQIRDKSTETKQRSLGILFILPWNRICRCRVGRKGQNILIFKQFYKQNLSNNRLVHKHPIWEVLDPLQNRRIFFYLAGIWCSYSHAPSIDTLECILKPLVSVESDETNFYLKCVKLEIVQFLSFQNQNFRIFVFSNLSARTNTCSSLVLCQRQFSCAKTFRNSEMVKEKVAMNFGYLCSRQPSWMSCITTNHKKLLPFLGH